ncbi:TetR/AcrR family transcriptional regulator [Aquifex sp.]
MIPTREKILKAAAEIIAHEGLRQFTAKNLASKVGISDAAIFKHFSTMDEIAEEIIRRYTSECLSRTREAVNSGGNSIEKLEKVIETHIELLEKTKGVVPIICFEFARSNKRNLKRLINEFLETYAGMIKDVLEEGIKKGEIAADIDLDEASFSFIGFMQAKAFQWFIRGKKGKIIKDKETVKKLLLRGLKKL